MTEFNQLSKEVALLTQAVQDMAKVVMQTNQLQAEANQLIRIEIEMRSPPPPPIKEIDNVFQLIKNEDLNEEQPE